MTSPFTGPRDWKTASSLGPVGMLGLLPTHMKCVRVFECGMCMWWVYSGCDSPDGPEGPASVDQPPLLISTLAHGATVGYRYVGSRRQGHFLNNYLLLTFT